MFVGLLVAPLPTPSDGHLPDESFFPFFFVQILPAPLGEKTGFLIPVRGILWKPVWGFLGVCHSNSVVLTVFRLINRALRK